MSHADKKPTRAKRAAPRSPALRSGDMVLSGPKTSEARILQLTNDISEGYKTGTKDELRACVTFWMLKHCASVASEQSLAHDLLHFAIKQVALSKPGARENVPPQPRDKEASHLK